MRQGDIVNIMLTDIDWRNSRFSITQNETKSLLVLPLEPDMKYAIADYILNGRPKMETQNVFLRQYAPHIGLSPQNIGTIFTRYMVNAGINHVPYDGKSIHALRLSIASWMLESGTSLETVSQVLRHKDINPAKRYLSFNYADFKKCALSLHGIEVTKEGLI